MDSILITGAAGFIGHHLVDVILKETDWQVTVIDGLDCSGNLNRLAEIGAVNNPRVKFIYHDLRSPINELLAAQIGPQNYIAHLAAGTHVDRSIDKPMEFVLDNVVATCNILEFARQANAKFLYFSTDEVFGPAPEGVNYKEDARYNSGNPYAATKAGGEELAVAYANTYGLKVCITHTMNCIGPRQHPEKFLPMTISKVMAGKQVLIHSNKDRTKAGSRFYIHAEDVAQAVLVLFKAGATGKYNIVGERELDNLQLAEWVALACKKDLDAELVDFHSSRPGHDLRYALDGSKMLKEFGWKPSRTIDRAIAETVEWSLANPQWLLKA